VNILVRSKVEKKAYLFVRELREALSKGLEGNTEIVGPAPLPFYRLRGHYRWHVLVKSRELGEAQRLIRRTLETVKRSSGVAMQVDVNPMNIL
jgi:primosomal protein N' (replication factor Y)